LCVCVSHILFPVLLPYNFLFPLKFFFNNFFFGFLHELVVGVEEVVLQFTCEEKFPAGFGEAWWCWMVALLVGGGREDIEVVLWGMM
jgi:hypothetical protein